jgi:hypothetical protein
LAAVAVTYTSIGDWLQGSDTFDQEKVPFEATVPNGVGMPVPTFTRFTVLPGSSPEPATVRVKAPFPFGMALKVRVASPQFKS